MRTCEEYELLISEFIDGTLNEAGRAELMAHMAGCPVCQAYFDDQIAIHDALSQLEEIPAPAGLASQVMARVRETPQNRPPEKKTVPFPHGRRWAALAACCAIVVVGVLGFQGLDHTPPANQAALRSVASAPGGRMAEPEAPPAASAEDGIALQMEDAPSLAAMPAAPASMDPEAPLGQEKIVEGQRYAGTLSTASPTAGAWVAEHLGLAWESGSSYTLSEEEYAALRNALLAAEEPFDEMPGEAGGSSYLLLAE